MIWLVDFPTFQYNEDVKELADKAGYQIVDSKFKDLVDADNVVKGKDIPKLTKKADNK